MADTDDTVLAQRILAVIDGHPKALRAKDIVEVLKVDKSKVNRMLYKLKGTHVLTMTDETPPKWSRFVRSQTLQSHPQTVQTSPPPPQVENADIPDSATVPIPTTIVSPGRYVIMPVPGEVYQDPTSGTECQVVGTCQEVPTMKWMVVYSELNSPDSGLLCQAAIDFLKRYKYVK
eukprot:GILJ01011055.1.p1 GENE.GILJ01011055.1~~GILJ01011055.1.p1  ORF type:complete len:193 (+),score=9.03 GILJ01011055.1:57-581(+)